MARRPNQSAENVFTPQELKAMGRSLALLSEPAVREIYQRAYRECLVVNTHQLPSARSLQELVQAWKQLRKWRRS